MRLFIHLIVVILITAVIGLASETGTNISPFLTLVVVPYTVFMVVKAGRSVGARHSINR